MYRVTIYRDGSDTPVIYERVKHVWLTPDSSALNISYYTHGIEKRGNREIVDKHDYIIWLTCNISHFRVEHVYEEI